ncbi:hypothetical protein [Haloarcula sp. K1]|uniref:hypothetical protein n=1 Tax=Haloarcula sp. K1 TaxID=1622207 RepID=UPI0007BB25E7|nr:hypothetical protein [Haloarcula sp. K1]KZX46344.1 hypothetical protein AV929_16370 [Haloarcula sp. K1]
MNSPSTSAETSRKDPEKLSDEDLVDVYSEVAEAPTSGYSVAYYDAIVQEMAERFEANVLNNTKSE